jgi:hypothetical protein
MPQLESLDRVPCPWCSWSTPVVLGHLAEHGLRFNREYRCPASGSTPDRAQEAADRALCFHAATGDHLTHDEVWG